MSNKENSIVEYNCIKEEIQNKIELHNTLITFTITTVVAILTFAVSSDNPFLFLVPFCILIPMSSRIAYYRLALSKLSAYLIVFLEPKLDGCDWETRNYVLVNQKLFNKRNGLKESVFINYYDFFLLCIICYVLFLFYYLQDFKMDIMRIFNILWPLSAIFYEFMLTKRMNSGNKKKEEWIRDWNELKQTELNKNNLMENRFI